MLRTFMPLILNAVKRLLQFLTDIFIFWCDKDHLVRSINFRCDKDKYFATILYFYCKQASTMNQARLQIKP